MMIPNPRLAQARKQAQDWQQALKIALEPLHAAGYTSVDYCQGVIDNTLAWGPYYIVAPGVALPHARPEQGAIATGISITTLEEPVCFGHEDCDPVWLLLPLCATDANAHLATIQRISALLENEGLLTQLREAKSDSLLLSLLNNEAIQGEQ